MTDIVLGCALIALLGYANGRINPGAPHVAAGEVLFFWLILIGAQFANAPMTFAMPWKHLAVGIPALCFAAWYGSFKANRARRTKQPDERDAK